MNINEQLEIAKQCISDNELAKALKILRSLMHFKADVSLKEGVCFEIGKLYMMLGENKKSIRYLSKISKNFYSYNFVVELLLKNYKILNLQNKIIDTLNKNTSFQITEQMMKEILESVTDSDNFLMIFKFINNYKNKINNYDEILSQIYNKLAIYVQILSKNHQYSKVRELFKKVNRYIPKAERKLKNILLNEYELARNQICLKSYPRIMNLVLTTKCNLKCIMCKKEEHDGMYNLSNKTIKDLIEIMPYLEKLVLRGGEVFLHDKIVYILEQAKKYQVDVEIVTNGLLLTEKIINLLVEVLTEITFSIDSVNKETYEKIRVGAKFEKLLKNIELFNNFNKKRNYKVLTRLTMVVMHSNYKEIEDVIKFAGEHNFKEVYLLPVRGIQADKTELIFSHGFDKKIMEDLSNKKTRFAEIAQQYSVKLYNMLPNKKTNFNDTLIYKEVSLTKLLYKYSTSKYYSLMKNSMFFQERFLKNSLSLKFNKGKSKNVVKYCHAPWKQIFLFNLEGIPTCLCKILFAKLNSNKKNIIMNIWNNKVMQYYRYKIIKNEYKNFCSNDCNDNIKML